jgi:sulfur relay (sulfurtransferase) DsrC/TusE family protein
LFQTLFEEKNKLDKNYTGLLADIKQWMDDAENRVAAKHGEDLTEPYRASCS